jgi:GPH family glycoside/pentoside/hexuronide:cation symporter
VSQEAVEAAAVAPAALEESGSPARALSRATLVTYALPSAVWAAATMTMGMFLMKYSTDVLLIAPGAMGAIFFAARLWDAFSDPVAGHLSDRTIARRGRRRSWMILAALPLALTLVMIWAQPAAIGGLALVAWMAAALLLYATAATAFLVPYGALGMELTDDYHERTRLFAWRHVIFSMGFLLGMGFVYTLRTAESPRGMALLLAAGGGVFLAASVVYAALRLPERAEYQGRGGANLWRGFGDVLRNSHARLLFIVYAIESFGAGSIMVMVPYVMDDVMGAYDLFEILIALYVIPQFLLVPLWVWLSRRIGKKALWMLGMAAVGPGYGGVVFSPELGPVYLGGLILLIGSGTGIASVAVPAIKADVIDYDEYLTGERKEGAYTAAWNFIRKAGGGVALGAGGLALQLAGYDATAEVQTQSVRHAILLMASVLPAAGYLIGLLLFSRYSLNEQEHAQVLAQIRSRRESRETREGGC